MIDSPQATCAHGWRLEHTYATLPKLFRVMTPPVPVRKPEWTIFNRPLARKLGLDDAALGAPENAALFAGNILPDGASPLAQAYAGHQFGHFTGLGDGRAILLGEQITPSGERFDIQFKGSGPTPYSRRGDGRAALGPMLREYIISEAMHALGIPTTRSLAVVTTGEMVYRQTPLPGAVLTRVASSHIRVGTFEWAAAHQDHSALKVLADYTLQRHFPNVATLELPYLKFFESVMERQAALVAQWMLVGFIHGVMNTDNMALSGETIDYGPCAFMNTYDPKTVFSSIDHHGRYAYGNQPHIAQWNLARLAEALLPLIHPQQENAVALANEAIGSFEVHYKRHWLAGMRAKLGLFTAEAEDEILIEELLAWMQTSSADFTNTFRQLSQDKPLESALMADPNFAAWHGKWITRRTRQAETLEASSALMRRHNPAIIPRNHQVEAALEAATANGDLSVMHRLLGALEQPYEEAAEHEAFTIPPPTNECYQTFCGT